MERVPNAATLVVGDQRIRLSGIDPGPIEDLGPFEKWVEAQGDLICEPDARTERYHCLTGEGVDVAEAAILNGTGHVGDGARPNIATARRKRAMPTRRLSGATLKCPSNVGAEERNMNLWKWAKLQRRFNLSSWLDVFLRLSHHR